MNRRQLGTSSLYLSTLGMGCNRLGSIGARQSRRESVSLVREAVDSGVSWFDTADAYGKGASESVLGEALRGVPSDDVLVATKVGYRFEERSRSQLVARGVLSAARSKLPSALSGTGATAAYSSQDFSGPYIRRAVADSLRRLQRDRIDLLQFHGAPPTDRSDLPEVVTELIASGAVGAFGIGCESLAVAESWMRVPGVAALQIPFGVLDPAAADELIPRIRAAGIGVIVRGILGGGVIARFERGQDLGIERPRVLRLERLRTLATRTSVELAQIAVWYARFSVDVDVALLGMTSRAQRRDGIRYFSAAEPSAETLAAITAIISGETIDG